MSTKGIYVELYRNIISPESLCIKKAILERHTGILRSMPKECRRCGRLNVFIT